MRSSSTLSLTLITALSAVGCFGAPPSDDETGQALAEVQSIPAGVGCLRVVFRAPGATADTTRNIAVTPGAASSFDLGYLVAGTYSFRPSAYNVACGSVAASTNASWVGDAVSATITPGLITRLSITLRPNVTTGGTVDFVQPVRAIYSGRDSASTYAVMQDGTVRAWGFNESGQLGDGTTINARVPRTVVGLSNPTQIVASWNYACATTAGGLTCWGAFGGLLGDTLGDRSLTPRTNPDLEPLAIETGYRAMCGDLGDGWRCWSSSADLYSGRTFRAQSVVVPRGGFSTLAATPGVALDRPILFVNNYGALQHSDAFVGSEETFTNRVTSVAVVNGNYCAVVVGGDVLCAGYPTNGLYGNDTSSEVSPFMPTRANITQVTAITGSLWHFCALRRDRTVWCWGSNNVGQLGGDVNVDSASTPVQVPITDVTQIVSGVAHSCALKTDGTVWCWGYNYYGTLGDGTEVNRFAPVRVQF